MNAIPSDLCDNYGQCGANSVCTSYKSSICECLEGFIPKSPEEWKQLIWSSGCMRRTPLDCQRKDGFIKLAWVKLPDLLEFWLNKSMSTKECEAECLKNCSCTAYANSDIRGGGNGCLIWFGDLIDIRGYSEENDISGYSEEILGKTSIFDCLLQNLVSALICSIAHSFSYVSLLGFVKALANMVQNVY